MKENEVNKILKNKFKELEISSLSFQAGGIYRTKDKNVLFPGRNKNNIKDKVRMVIVMGNPKDLSDPMIPIVLCAPITTVQSETTQCLPIDSGDGNLHYDSLIKAGMIQPILKVHLKKFIGSVKPSTLNQLKATVFMNLGLDEEDDLQLNETQIGGDNNETKD